MLLKCELPTQQGNKVSDMKDLTDRLFPTVLWIGEIKLDTRIPNVLFCLNDYYNQGLL